MTSETPCSMVELTIACKNLRDMDVLSKSDPMCVVYLKKTEIEDWAEIGRTEMIKDNLNPEFSNKIPVVYMFERRQLMKFEVYDVDSSSTNLADHDFIGQLETTLADVVSSAGLAVFERNLTDRKGANSGKITVIAEELLSFKETYSLKFDALDLPRRLFGNFSFFYEIHKPTEGSGELLVFRSAMIKGKGAVQFPATELNSHALCNGKIDNELRITLMRRKTNGNHISLGDWKTTVQALTEQASTQPASFKLSSGATIRLISIAKASMSTFLDFVKAGVQINCVVAVDFTSSNGQPNDPKSLHYMDPNKPNSYQIALKSVLDIIKHYDSDQLFPALGFGAQLPPTWEVSHEFYLNFNPSSPYCKGIEGVMDAYAKSLSNVRLYGPTNFASIVNHVSKFAYANQGGKEYFILLIITDGEISDMAQTTNAIVASSSLPVSIVIVGVGSANFKEMNKLDADKHDLVDSAGRHMERDIVQFVPFNEILHRANDDIHAARIELAREVLAEIPNQFLSYLRKIDMTAEKIGELVQQK